MRTTERHAAAHAATAATAAAAKRARLRPWPLFVAAGIALGASLALLGFSRPQDAAKLVLWWFVLGGGLLGLAARRCGRVAGRVWLLLCLVFGLDGAVQGVLRGFFGAQPQPAVLAQALAEALANTSAAEVLGFVLGQRGPLALATLYGGIWGAIGLGGRRVWQRADDLDLDLDHEHEHEHERAPRTRARPALPLLLLAVAAGLHANPTLLRSEPFLRWAVLYQRHLVARAEMQQLAAQRAALWATRAQWQVQRVDAQPRTVVLFIGESANRSNWGLYGYARDTTAPLAQSFEGLGGQLLLFTQARSTEAFTLPSLRLALTPATRAQPQLWREAPDLVMLARAAGYRVSWLSNQPGSDGWIASLGRDADAQAFINHGNWRDSSAEDEALVPVLRAQLQGAPPRDELIVVHLLGQHFHYALRCGGQAGPFAKVADDAVMRALRAQGRSGAILQARNDYDDATWCGARALGQMLQTLAQARPGRALAALYFSDHGQEVGHTRDFAGHSAEDASGYAVPLWIWRNAQAQALPIDASRLQAPILLDTLDMALQHLLGLRSRWYDAQQDFLSPAYRALQPEG